jgi:hypothetical protein
MPSAAGFKRLLLASSALSFIYFLAIAGVSEAASGTHLVCLLIPPPLAAWLQATGTEWTRYHSASAATASIVFCAVLLQNAVFYALLLLFPKPSHLRALAGPVYVYHLSLGAILLTLSLTAAVLDSLMGRFCTRCGAVAPSEIIGFWLVLPGLVAIALGMLFWWYGKGEELEDVHNPESAAARTAPPIWALAILSVLSTGVLFMLILAGQLLRYHTPPEYEHMLSAYSDNVNALLAVDSTFHPLPRHF